MLLCDSKSLQGKCNNISDTQLGFENEQRYSVSLKYYDLQINNKLYFMALEYTQSIYLSFTM